MKKYPLILLISAGVLLLSCSAEENSTEENNLKKIDNTFADAFRKGFEGLTIDFSKLFDYTTAKKAATETGKAFAFITFDMQEELAKRPDCDHAFVSFSLYNGKAILLNIFFADSEKGIYTECFAYNRNGVRSYIYFAGNPPFYKESMENNAERYTFLAAPDDNPDFKNVEDFIASRLKGPDDSADFMVYVDGTSSKLFGAK